MNKCRYIILTGLCLLSVFMLKAADESLSTKDIRLILDSIYFYRSDNPDKSIIHADNLIEALDDSLSAYMAEALLYRCMAKKYKTDYTEAINNCFASFDIAQENDNVIAQVSALNLIGNIYKIQKEYDKAIGFYVKSLKIGESLYPQHHEIAETHNSIGSIFSKLKKFEEADKHFSAALKIKKAAFNTLSAPNEDKKITERLAATYQDMGVRYWRVDSFNTALSYYKKSRSLNEAMR